MSNANESLAKSATPACWDGHEPRKDMKSKKAMKGQEQTFRQPPPLGRTEGPVDASPVAVLYARGDSIYRDIEGCDVWDAVRDARNFPGGTPVVAHPPCRAWGQLSHMASPGPWEHHLARLAVWQVRDNGGVLEHPLRSKLWRDQKLPKPGDRDEWGGWSMTIPQRWFGHPMEKLTILYVCGCEPSDAPTVPYTMEPATHAMGGKWLPGIKKRLGGDGIIREDARAGKVREGTPPAFADWLVDLARRCRPRRIYGVPAERRKAPENERSE